MTPNSQPVPGSDQAPGSDSSASRASSVFRSSAAVVRRSPLIAIIIVTVAVFGILRPDFLSLGSLLDIGQQIAVVAVVGFAMTAVIIARGIDISVGATLAVSGIVAAQLLVAGWPGPVAIAGAVVCGAIIGVLNGLLIGFLRISPLIVTLGMMAFGNGAALALSNSSSIGVDDTTTLLAGGSYVGPIPSAVIIAIVCMLGWMFVLGRTVYGRWIYAVGGNAEAARASLVPARIVALSTFVLTGASAGLGAVMTIGRVGSAQPLAGMGLEFAAITAAVVGGAKLAGGSGTAGGTMLGAIFVGVINAGLSFLQVPQQAIYLITGALVIVAVLVTQRAEFAELVGRVRRRMAAGASGDSGGGISGSGTTSDETRKLELVELGKRFPGVRALHGVTFTISAGEVIALAGENGAGKSTLVKILAGVQEPDDGQLKLDGSVVRLRSPEQSRRAGVSVIHQHFSVVPDLTVLENLFLGREPTIAGVLRRGWMRRRAHSLLADLGLSVPLAAPVASLTVGERQLVEVAKAMLDDSWLVIMDEPTSALSGSETARLYDVVRRLSARGVAVLYISHRMEEVFDLASRAVVLRDGAFVADRPIEEFDESSLIATMVGREVDNVFPYRPAEAGRVLLEVDGISDGGRLKEASLTVRAGEVVALAGLMGSGRSEVLRCVAGLSKSTAGTIQVDGSALTGGNVIAASRSGVAYVPEDRHTEGVVPAMSVRDNLSLAWLRGHSRAGLVPAEAGTLATEQIERLNIRPPDPGRAVGVLSGGNQQKVVLGRWLATEPRVLLLDEPTSGVDVGAKAEIHRLIGDVKERGIGVLMVSSELPEVLGVADRIYVMHDGRLAGELDRGASEQDVMELAFGQREMATEKGGQL